jgi:hypothetical protein
MKFQVNARSSTGGTGFSVEANDAQEALQKALGEVGVEYPVVEITEYVDYQQMPQNEAYANCLMACPPVLASARIGDPRNPYFPHLPL